MSIQDKPLEAGHTPGPWRAGEANERFYHGNFIWHGERDNEPVAVVCDFNRYDRDAEREANARLIAAAPDLLAAVRELADTYGITAEYPIDGRPGFEAYDRQARAIRAARAAIAKATEVAS